RRDGLLVLEAGLAQVDVDVDEAGTDDLARGVDDLGALGRGQPGAHALDHPALEPHVGDRVDLVGRIDDPPVPDQHTHAFSPQFLFPARRNSTPLLTATPLATGSRMPEYGPSATSGDSSMPRLTGPGCMISTSGRAWAESLSSVRPQ